MGDVFLAHTKPLNTNQASFEQHSIVHLSIADHIQPFMAIQFSVPQWPLGKYNNHMQLNFNIWECGNGEKKWSDGLFVQFVANVLFFKTLAFSQGIRQVYIKTILFSGNQVEE